MRLPFALLLTGCAGIAAAQQAPRVPIEDSGASVVHPAGWTGMPVSGIPPVVMFNLCDSAVRDGCLVRGEMTLSAPRADDTLDSVEARLAAAQVSRQPGQPEARRIKSGAHDAVETFWEGPHSNHISQVVKRGFIQIRTDTGWYECMLTAAPDLFPTQVDQWREFCASLDVTATTD